MATGLCILGSTGSIGSNALRVVNNLDRRFRVVSLTAGKNLELFSQQILKFRPVAVSVASSDYIQPLKDRLSAASYRSKLKILVGTSGQSEAATLPEVDFVISASHGVTGLVATYDAVRAGKRIGLANKETMVAAGELVTNEAKRRGVEILPIDSEHSAIHQCLRSGRREEIRRLVLTGSGGPFLNTPKKEFARITPERALRHPIWKMGGRITIDSATLMNKGLEIIEAHWLFGFPSNQIDVLIHPESVVHSMIEFCDGSVLAQLAVADMRLPIQYALTYPERAAVNGDIPGLDLLATQRLSFLRPNSRRFPCLELGREALEKGGALPCALNAADEIAVEAFLARRLKFSDIPKVIERVMRSTSSGKLGTIDQVLACDLEARHRSAECVRTLAKGRSN